ncbi:MAG: T9SS type A sorting domain-containing protein [Bacteroidia bacterium]
MSVLFMLFATFLIPDVMGQVTCNANVWGPNSVCLNSTQSYNIQVNSSSSNSEFETLFIQVQVNGGFVNGTSFFTMQHNGNSGNFFNSVNVTWTSVNGGSVQANVMGGTGCSGTEWVSIIGDQPDFALAFACQNAARTIYMTSGQNANSISWSTDNGSISGQGSSAVLTPSTVGTANVTVTTVDGCGQTRTNTEAIEVRDDALTSGQSSFIQGQWLYESYGNTSTVSIWNPDPKATFYEWWGLVPVSEYTSPNSVAVINPQIAPGNYYIYTRAGNGCAVGPTMSMRVYIYTNNGNNPPPYMVLENEDPTMNEAIPNIGEPNSLELQVYPNPTNEHTEVKVPSHMGNVTKVIVLNKAGDRVMEYQDVGSELGINTANLEEGIYFLKILLDSGKQVNKRLVVNHP